MLYRSKKRNVLDYLNETVIQMMIKISVLWCIMTDYENVNDKGYQIITDILRTLERIQISR